MLRKLTAIVCLVSLFCSLSYFPVQAIAPQPETNVSAPPLKAEEERQLLEAFLEKRATGEHPRNILTHKVVAFHPDFSRQEAASLIDLSSNLRNEETEPFVVRYVAVDYKLSKESCHRLNGLNYRFVIYVYKDGKWQIDRYVEAPVHMIVERGIGFNTADEIDMAKIDRLRDAKGICTNRQGVDVQVDPRATAEDLQQEMSGPQPANLPPSKWVAMLPPDINPNYARPSKIKVLMTTPENLAYYRCGTQPCVQEMPFLDYIKHVLPAEWPLNTPPEALKAAALSTKMYAWYTVFVNPLIQVDDVSVLDVAGDANIKDSEPNLKFRATYQDRSPEERAKIEEMMKVVYADGVAGVGFKDGISNDLIIPLFERQPVMERNLGRLSIPGAIALAKQGKNAPEILQHYYEGSDKMESGASLTYFRYAMKPNQP